MKEDIQLLKRSRLFNGINEDEIKFLLDCLSAHNREYFKGEYIYRYGDKIDAIGVVLLGKVLVFNEDYWGNRSIMAELSPGDLFGETFASTNSTPITVSVVATEDARVMFLGMRKALTTCEKACDFHHKLIRNLVGELAEKNLLLNEKIGHMSKRTTREKLLSYLSSQSRKHGSLSFEIPFNRQQLADYLGVDRTAMSKELSKLRVEGVIDFDRRGFIIGEKARTMSGYIEMPDGLD